MYYVLQLEMDLQKVKVERLRSSKAVGDYMETFERKRTQDLKVTPPPHACMHVNVQQERLEFLHQTLVLK